MHPEHERMLRELDLLKAEYANQCNNRHVLMDWAKPQLESLYFLRVGDLQIELLLQKAKMYAAKRKLEMIQKAINRNEEISLPFIDMMVELEMQEQTEKIEQAVEKLNQAKNLLSNLESPERSAELRKIFREMAKELHPDINTDLSEGAKNLWNAVLLAYETCNLESLRALRLLVWEVRNKNQHFSDENALMSQISMMKDGINRLLAEMHAIRMMFPFTLEKEMNDDAWVEIQRAALKTETQTVEKRKIQYEKSIALILQTLEL